VIVGHAEHPGDDLDGKGTLKSATASKRSSAIALRYWLTFAWAILSLVTIVTWWLAHTSAHDGQGTALTVTTMLVLGIAVIKVRIIIRQFMDVRTAPTWLKAFTDIWLTVVAALIVAIYLW
jgi:hypothetical protein